MPSSHSVGPNTLVSVALEVILESHPGQLSIDEAIRQITFGSSDAADRDAISNAIRDLAGDGLLHRHGDYVFATRAAVRFNELGL